MLDVQQASPSTSQPTFPMLHSEVIRGMEKGETGGIFMLKMSMNN